MDATALHSLRRVSKNRRNLRNGNVAFRYSLIVRAFSSKLCVALLYARVMVSQKSDSVQTVDFLCCVYFAIMLVVVV